MKNSESSHIEDLEEAGEYYRDRFKRNAEGTSSLSKAVLPSSE